MDKYEKLKEMKSLLDSGLLNQEEFNKLKNEILFSEDITQNKESKFINNFSKPDSLKKDNNNETSSIFNYLFVFGVIIVFVFYFNKNTITNKIESFNTIDTTAISSDYETNKSNEINRNTCSICGREFSGKGYEEISEGNWQQLTEGQGFICSTGCGRKHTQNMNHIIDKYSTNNSGYQQGNDGRIYEKSACSLCKGTGIETSNNIANGETDSRICPMCEGRGVRSY